MELINSGIFYDDDGVYILLSVGWGRTIYDDFYSCRPEHSQTITIELPEGVFAAPLRYGFRGRDKTYSNTLSESIRDKLLAYAESGARVVGWQFRCQALQQDGQYREYRFYGGSQNGHQVTCHLFNLDGYNWTLFLNMSGDFYQGWMDSEDEVMLGKPDEVLQPDIPYCEILQYDYVGNDTISNSS